MGHGHFLNSTGRHDQFLNSTGRQKAFLKSTCKIKTPPPPSRAPVLLLHGWLCSPQCVDYPGDPGLCAKKGKERKSRFSRIEELKGGVYRNKTSVFQRLTEVDTKRVERTANIHPYRTLSTSVQSYLPAWHPSSPPRWETSVCFIRKSVKDKDRAVQASLLYNAKLTYPSCSVVCIQFMLIWGRFADWHV